MRSAHVPGFLLLAVVALGFSTAQLTAGFRTKPQNKQVIAVRQPELKPWSTTTEGRGSTPELAEELALTRAELALRARLREYMPGLRRLPSTEYIQENLVKHREFDELTDPGLDPLTDGRYRAVLEIGLDGKDYDKLLRYDRELSDHERRERSRDRIVVVGKGFGILLALLGAVAGYFRLEEATKGYYTTWLRIAAATFVGAVGAGLWLVS